jgi:purine-binding chemotaxis protein CheW
VTNDATRKVLLIRCAESLCALPLSGVLETMRALPLEPVHDAPEFVLGMALIRGEFIPVVDFGALLTGSRGHDIARYITLVSGGRHIALGLSDVLGVRELPARDFSELPALLCERDSPFVVALARLDSQLLRVLRDARVWADSLGELLPAQGEHAGA